jgi:phosphoglucosamine mutase
MFVDHNGHVVDGDEILFILAQAAFQKGEMVGGVVGTLMSNLGLELALKQMDIPFVRAKVGDRYVVEQLKETGWQLGGEGSGHILSLKHASTGDGIVASLQVLKAILESGKRLSDIKAGMTKLPQVLINVRLSSGSADSILALDSVKQAVVKAEGILGDQGRVLLRKSGTEPLIRVMVESTDNLMTQTQAEFIADAVRAA